MAVRQAFVLLLVALLLLIPSTPGAIGAPGPNPPVGKPIRDGDHNKIFDDLDEVLASSSADQPFPVIVVLREIITPANVDSLRQRVGAFETRFQYPSINGFAVTLTKGQIIALAQLGEVAHIESDLPAKASLDKATYWFGVQKARGDFKVDGNADGLPTYSKNDIVIAILDTGIYNAHTDVSGGKVIGWTDLHAPVTGADPTCSTPCDPQGHGTHVSSIAAGTGAASGGLYAGVAPGAALVGVRVLDKNGAGSASVVNAGIQWVINNKATFGIKVFNLSLGIAGCFDDTHSVAQMVDAAVAQGLIAVVAAGNEGPATCTIGSPASAQNAITVGAMADPQHGAALPGVCPGVGSAPEGGFYLACFSSRGPTADNRIKPDIAAPGVGITAAQAGTTSGYVELSGTSMATPFTAGVAGLMLQANPSLTPSQVKSMLMNTAIDWGPPGPDIDYGAGRLDGYAAVRAAAATGGTNIALPLRQHVEGSLAAAGQPGDTRNYSIKITNTLMPLGVTIIISSWKADQSVDFDAILLDKNGVVVARSESASRQETIGLTSPTAGPYTLRIFAWPGAPPSFPPSLGGNYFFDLSDGGCIDNGSADLDGDGFSNAVEASVGTDACSPCGTDAWPADISNDTFSDITDIAALAGNFGKSVPPAPARYDIAPDPPDHVVDITDIAKMAGFSAIIAPVHKAPASAPLKRDRPSR